MIDKSNMGVSYYNQLDGGFSDVAIFALFLAKNCTKLYKNLFEYVKERA